LAAFTVIIVIGIGGALFIAGRSAEVEFRRFAHGSAMMAGRWGDLAATLADYYAVRGSWAGVERVIPRMGMRGHGMGGGPTVLLVDDGGRVVYDEAGASAGVRLNPRDLGAGLPILVEGRRVGTLLVAGGPLLTTEQQLFLRRMRAALALSGGVALLVALLLGALLVRGITRPLRQLVAASEAVAAGELDTRVPVRSRDEIGELARAFNHMAADLAGAEEARSQQSADIAHELRTPLTVIQGQLEALIDGVFPADEEHLEPLLEQTQTLRRLVDDLRTLSLADAGQLTLARVSVVPEEWAAGVVAGFQSVAAGREIDLRLEVPRPLPRRLIDPQRLTQVLGNLLDNALRHTPHGGTVTVRLVPHEDQVRVSVSDSGAGVPPAQLARLFERFWRGDASRSRRTGGSGLGLAIARRIVEAHGGRIWAENAPAGGLRVTFTLPPAGSEACQASDVEYNELSEPTVRR
jgi:signal transduction histidine kinase